jgi:uncharacterized protein YlxW (UPF0749 family)
MATHAHRPARARRGRSLTWRLLAPVAFACAGVLCVTSMVSAAGTDLRAGRYDDLAGLAGSEAQQLEGLRAQVAQLTTEVDRLSKRLNGSGDLTAQRTVQALRMPAGLTPVRGPGLTVTLDDAPQEALAAAGNDVSDLLVHQQDIQAVANAMWAGGAEAMTIQNQRVVATTGIKCVGNTVVLHGVPYSPPYRITAIGPQQAMLDSIDTSPYIELYLQQVPRGLGWHVRREGSVTLPGYKGATELEYARPATAGAGR